MSSEEKAQAAFEMINAQIEELIGIVSGAHGDGDYERGFERLNRWKDRTAKLLSRHVSPQERAKFENKVLVRVISSDPFDSLDDEANEYKAFLESLMEELVRHPEYVFSETIESDGKMIQGKLQGSFWPLIHPIIAKVARERFDHGQFADAVESSFKQINKRVKDYVKAKIGKELDGASLMYHAFSPENPIIVLDDLKTVSGQDIQKGYMQIFAGSMTGVRNPKAHENIIIDEVRAIHFLFLASLLMFKLDEAGVP